MDTGIATPTRAAPTGVKPWLRAAPLPPHRLKYNALGAAIRCPTFANSAGPVAQRHPHTHHPNRT